MTEEKPEPKTIKLPIRKKTRKSRGPMHFARYLAPVLTVAQQKQRDEHDRKMIALQEKEDIGRKKRLALRQVELARKKKYNRWHRKFVKNLRRQQAK